MEFDSSFLENQVIDGFPITSTIRRAVAVQIKILQQVEEICKRHNIKYFAESGTLLGAIRHGGFIPWDDDLDIVMLRPDYMRFLTLAKKELPKGYRIINIYEDDCENYLLRIVNSEGINNSREFLADNFGCPYSIGIDIFVYDYLAPTEEAMQEQINDFGSLNVYVEQATAGCLDKNSAEHLLKQMEDKYNYRLPKARTTIGKLYIMQDYILSLYANDENATKIGLTPFWVKSKGHICAKKCYEAPLYVQFENTKIPVPAYYEQVLKGRYGDYMKLVKTGGLHDYPYFRDQMDIAVEHWGKSKFEFEWQENFASILEQNHNRKREIRNRRKELLKSYTDILENAYENIFKLLNNEQYELVLKVLEKCQEIAIALGNEIERIYGEDKRNVVLTIKAIEEYCESVFLLYNCIVEGNAEKLGASFDRIAEKTNAVLTGIDDNISNKRIVVFLTYRAKQFDSYKKCYDFENEKDSMVYVVPLPFFERNMDGTIKEKNAKVDSNFSINLEITDYSKLDLEKLCADAIYIQNIQEEYDSVTIISPRYYSKQLSTYTNELIYVSDINIADFDKSDIRAFNNIRDFILKPGIIYVDKIIAPTEKLRETYIAVITDWINSNNLQNIIDIYKEKLILSNKVSSVNIASDESTKEKKTILYYVSPSKILDNPEKCLDKIKRNLQIFADSSDRIKVKWILSDLTDDVLKEREPEFYEEYCAIINKCKVDGKVDILEFDENVLKSINYQAFYGDGGKIATNAIIAEKPVMIQNENV